MDSSKLKAIIVLLLSIFAALYLGIAAATSQIEVVAWVVSGIAVAVCIAMGRSIWLLVPFSSALILQFYYLPGKLDATQLGQLVFILFTSILFLMRRLRINFRFTELEIWSLLLLACVMQAYLRHPVGFSAIGSNNVGGKPYLNFFLAFVTCGMLSLIAVPPSEIRWMVRLYLIGGVISSVVAIVGQISPRLGLWLGSSSAEGLSSETGFEQRAMDSGMADRKGFLSPIAGTLSRWVASVCNPLVACIHPIYGTLMLISLAAAAFSGFRNQIAIVLLTYAVAQFYRGGLRSLVLCAVMGCMAVLILSLVNSIVPLPPNVQRVMTIFPGSWEQRYKDDAEGSTEWRTEMWIEALTNKRYIANTLIGDGLGMTAEQLELSAVLAEKKAHGITGFDLHREIIMINGDYHSGPVQTIRTIGYVGLLVLLVGMIRLAIHAHRQILRCRGTEWFSAVLFICLPMIWGPIYFVFIFGSFAIGALNLLVGTGLIRILEKSLPLPQYAPASRYPVPLPRPVATRHPGQSIG